MPEKNYPADLENSRVGDWLVPERISAFHAINTERRYQDEQRGNSARHTEFDPKEMHPAEALTYIRKCVRDAEEAAYRGTTGALDSLPYFRKIAALAVRVMEVYGAPERE